MTALLAGVVLLGACEDDSQSPGPQAFSLRIQVTDPAGQPLQGVQVSAWSRTTLADIDFKRGGSDPKPATVISYNLAADCRVELILLDLHDDVVCTLLDEPFTAGQHQAVWDGRLCDQSEAPRALPGVYRAVMTASDPQSEGVLFTDEIAMVLYTPEPDLTVLGTTDAQGLLTMNQKEWFPHLYEWDPFIRTDENGDIGEMFTYVDEARFYLKVGQEYASYQQLVGPGVNSITLVWDPQKAAPVFTPEIESLGRVRESRYLPEHLQEWELKQNYPNPFN